MQIEEDNDTNAENGTILVNRLVTLCMIDNLNKVLFIPVGCWVCCQYCRRTGCIQ